MKTILLVLIVGYILYKALYLLVIAPRRFGIGIMLKPLASEAIMG